MEQIATLIEHVPADDAMAAEVSVLLQKFYPGHTWVVQATASQGQLTIRNPSLSYKMGMRMFLPQFISHGDLVAKVMRYGGEFLERHGIPRAKAERDEVVAHWNLARFK